MRSFLPILLGLALLLIGQQDCCTDDLDGDGVTCEQDCDDSDPTVYPGAQELCDGKDNDCNTRVDDAPAQAWYRDVDRDGFGDDADVEGHVGCDVPGRVLVGGDCDDSSAGIYPGADEVCDGVDNDCDGAIDAGDPDLDGAIESYYEDVDGDGYGNPGSSLTACDPPDGYVDNPEDCDDADASVHPGALEQCDGKDNDCNGEVDDGEVRTWYRDADGDGFGDDENIDVFEGCDASGWVLVGGDCDDLDPEVRPDAEEVCDGVDNDCDATVDEADPDLVGAAVWYEDMDGDGYGVAGATMTACDRPWGYAGDPGDCVDTAPGIHPGALELCDGYDNDCDGEVDEDGVCESCPWLLEGFEDGTWPVAPWVSQGGAVSTSFAHDAYFGYHGEGEWSYRTDVALGLVGDLLTVWVYFSEGDAGRFYLGFDANQDGAKSLVLAANTSQLIFQANLSYGYENEVEADQVYASERWYYLEAEFLGDGLIEGRLYDADGLTPLNSLVVDYGEDLVGGVAIRSIDEVYGDSIAMCDGSE